MYKVYFQIGEEKVCIETFDNANDATMYVVAMTKAARKFGAMLYVDFEEV